MWQEFQTCHAMWKCLCILAARTTTRKCQFAPRFFPTTATTTTRHEPMDKQGLGIGQFPAWGGLNTRAPTNTCGFKGGGELNSSEGRRFCAQVIDGLMLNFYLELRENWIPLFFGRWFFSHSVRTHAQKQAVTLRSLSLFLSLFLSLLSLNGVGTGTTKISSKAAFYGISRLLKLTLALSWQCTREAWSKDCPSPS